MLNHAFLFKSKNSCGIAVASKTSYHKVGFGHRLNETQTRIGHLFDRNWLLQLHCVYSISKKVLHVAKDN